MRRSALVVAVVFLTGVIVLAAGTIWRSASRRPSHPTARTPSPARTADAAALSLLAEIPFYRFLLGGEAIRSAQVGPGGGLEVELDLRALLEPRLAALGLARASELFPETARGSIASDSSDPPSAARLRETWRFDGPAPVFDLLDRGPASPAARPLLDAIPGTPSALVSVRLSARKLADPSLGGAALSFWRDRADFAEKLLGRSVRSEIAEDLAGPAVFALYEGPDATQAEALLAFELRRSDRLSGLLDTLFGLGALTERASVVRYRGVSTGSYVPTSGVAGIALAVDGPVLLVATTRARLESAIDARREGERRHPDLAAALDVNATWSAVSSSAFVRQGWARLARAPDGPAGGTIAAVTASLNPEGASGWRLDGYGPTPAITADSMFPFFRRVLGGAQR